MLFQKRIHRKQKNRKKDSLSGKTGSYTPENRKRVSGKASACISPGNRKTDGSLTVECAVVLTIFFLSMTTLFGVMEVYQLQTEKLSQLCQTAKETGMYLGSSRDAPKELTLPVSYRYAPAVNPFSLPEITFHNSVKIHTWTGRSETETAEKTEEIVYITEISGRVYHKRRDCSYLKLSVLQTDKNTVETKRNQYGSRYYACERCETSGNRVYITKTGSRYHGDRNCSGLKRSVKAVKISSVSGWRSCSRCGG